jgi:L,D-peptidoglycan transpeptidase YkuD (ErfK/YbiS/YcfS/YnhG family)
MDLIVDPRGFVTRDGATTRIRCALGRGGVRADKREGDGATPAGLFPLRRLFFRADRSDRPASGLPTQALAPSDGWCDDPAHESYNEFVTLPFTARHERLWRDDALYDIVGVIGYNDAPVRAGLGSAIFLHVATSDYAPTEGCVALAPDDLRYVLALCDATTQIRILERSA